MWFRFSSFILLGLAVTSSSPPQSILKRITSHRVNPNPTSQSTTFLYSGRLSNPMTGASIANVKGVESIKPLNVATTISSLPVSCLRTALSGFSSSFDKANQSSFFVRRLFFYTPLSKKKTRTSSSSSSSSSGMNAILVEYKHTPSSPSKDVAVGQAAFLYDSVVSFGVSNSNSNGNSNSNSNSKSNSNSNSSSSNIENFDNDNVEIRTQSVFKDGSSVIGKIQVEEVDSRLKMNSVSRFLKKSDKVGEVKKCLGLLSGAGAGAGAEQSSTRRAIISFGRQKPMDKFGGAKETYEFEEMPKAKKWQSIFRLPFVAPWMSTTKKEKGKKRFRYSRLGECPSWYGPGRMCLLEMEAVEVPSTIAGVRGEVAEVLADEEIVVRGPDQFFEQGVGKTSFGGWRIVGGDEYPSGGFIEVARSVWDVCRKFV